MGRFGKIGFLQVLEDVNSANWNDTEIFPASKNARTVLTDAFVSDVNNTTPSQVVNWLIDFDYNLMKNGFAHSQGHDFLTWEDFERVLDDIFGDRQFFGSLRHFASCFCSRSRKPLSYASRFSK